MLVPTDEIRDAILDGASAHRIRREMKVAGLPSMRETALEMVEQGVTSRDEVDRVLGNDEDDLEDAEPRGRSRILVADDDRMLRMLLEQEDYEGVEAENGRQAVEVAQAERPDLILMDLTMLEMDGYRWSSVRRPPPLRR